MSTYGQTLLGTFGSSIELSADGRPEMKHIGITVDWATVAAVGADTTLLEGVFIPSGQKYLRYGQVLTLIGVGEVQTVTFTGGPTSGAATVTLPAGGGEIAQATAPIAFNATAADFMAALAALYRIGPNGATVARTGAGTAGDPYVYTVTFNRRAGDVPTMTATHTFAGGTTPTVTFATTTPGGASGGKYGPYDSAATDGRATITKGETYLLNRTVREIDLHSDHPPALVGGLVFRDRIIATTGSASLAAGPTFANLDAAMPRLQYVSETPD
jgi:hypothetical protein